MGTITGLTASRMLEIEAESIIDGNIIGDDLFLTRHDGTVVNAGNVRGPQGTTGQAGSALEVLAAQPVLDVGTISQIRAGRQLAAADFTAMGLSAPIGLWNLTNLADVSGNGRSLTNKGAVLFGTGINGVASSAASFSGSTAQALYIPDAGAGDPFRIQTGSWGCWFRTSKRATLQSLLSKLSAAAGNYSYVLRVNANDVVEAQVSINGTTLFTATGISDVADNRYHFAEASFDGSQLRLYVDGHFEGSIPAAGNIFGGTGPLNIGARSANAATAATEPHWGLVDEAFVLSNAIFGEEARNLYCASIPHTLGSIPKGVNLSVRRKLRAQAMAPSPKVAADHIEALEAGRLLAIFDTIETTDLVDLAVT